MPGSSVIDKNTRNEPPGGKISFPFSVSTKVVPGSPLLTNAFTPPVGSPVTFDANSNFTLGLGIGRIAVFEGVTRVDSEDLPGAVELNQN